MNASEALAKLKAMGIAQNRKVYARHGVSDPMFGVSYANLGVLQKAIGTDQEVARELWASGNHDARVLACKVADPEALRARELDAWVREVRDHVICAAFASLVASSPVGRKRVARWTASKNEWVAAVGWSALASMEALGELPSEAELEAYLEIIEREIHGRPNRTRYSMNNALIAIGLVNPGLQRKAIAAAKRIGPVEVDHGETGCKTPDAASYIAKAVAHRAGKKKKAAKKKAAKAPARRTGARSR